MNANKNNVQFSEEIRKIIACKFLRPYVDIDQIKKILDSDSLTKMDKLAIVEYLEGCVNYAKKEILVKS